MSESRQAGTRKACVMGYRVAYSRSPMIHNHWLRSLGMQGAYELMDIAPEAFPEFFRNLAGHGFVGGNVTTPHKDAAFRLVEHREGPAEAIGAVNTVWYEGDRLIGGNTDFLGFLANLDESAPGWDTTGPAVVIGAGGAARAVVYGLLERGLDVAVVNRTVDKAQALAARFGRKVTAHGMSEAERLLPQARLLANASSLGANGQPRLEVDLASLHPAAVVCDINYVPLKTALLRAAELRGHRIADGLGMLMHQAGPGFARWFGTRPRVTPDLRALLEADIRAQAVAGTGA
jgi:shikimate dehydrogenase